MNRRGWTVVVLGLVVSIAPLVWVPLTDNFPGFLSWEDASGAVFLLWSAVPFAVLAFVGKRLKTGTALFFVSAILIAAGTVLVQVDVFLYETSSTAVLALGSVPVLLSLAVGTVLFTDWAIRAGARSLRRVRS